MSEVLSLDALRARVRRLEAGAVGRRAVAPLGAAALDARLPGGGLPLAGLHEVAGERAEWDDGVALGFTLALLSRALAKRPGPVLWVAGRLDLHAPGLLAAGIDPGELVLARAGAEADRLWAMEEGLRAARGKAAAFAAVVGEVAALDRTAGRRLQLAAEAGGLPCFLLRRQLTAARRGDGPSAALTRWRVAPLPSEPLPSEPLPSEPLPSEPLASEPLASEPLSSLEGVERTPAASAALRASLARLPGRARWRVALLRCRGAAPADFLVEWNDATGDFGLVAPLRDGSLEGEPQADGAAHSLGRLAGQRLAGQRLAG